MIDAFLLQDLGFSLPPPLDILPLVLRGLQTTVYLTLAGAGLALLVAIIAGVARSSKFWLLRVVVGFYVELFRGTSVLVQMFWAYYVLPFFGIDLSAFAAGTLALGLNVGAYGSEIVRSSIAAVPTGQTEAAIALNMSPVKRMQRIIFPQAIRRMIPPMGNLLIELLKVTSLAAFITIPELTFEAKNLRIFAPARTTEIFTTLLLVYFAIAFVLTMGVRWLERRYSRGFVGGH